MAFARRVGLIPEEQLFAACADWLGRSSLQSLRQPLPDANEIARSWISCLDARGSPRDEVRIFTCSLFREFLSPGTPNASAVDARLRGHYDGNGPRLNRAGSWFEATRRLLAALYHLGRLGEPTEDKQKLLREAQEIADFLIANDWLVERKPALKQKYHGFRGVSSLLLARNAENRRELFLAASQDLEVSGAHGDHCLEHDEYLVEAYLHLQEIDGGETWLKKAEAVLAPLRRYPHQGGRLLGLVGSVTLQRGFAYREVAAVEQALSSFKDAASLFTRALASSPDPTMSDEYLLVQRGQAFFSIAHYLLATR